jgi:hypothetical protein
VINGEPEPVLYHRLGEVSLCDLLAALQVTTGSKMISLSGIPEVELPGEEED